jgi:integrase
MKASREHRVPLSEAAVSVLKEMQAVRQNEYVFPGDRRPQLSNMALLMVLRRMKRSGITAHGFRATFRTWAAERTNFPREVVEAALAHIVGNKTEVAYQRGDMFAKRQRLMDAWAEFCSKKTTAAVVFPLSKG